MEIWKDIKGYGGHYQISNYGNVKSQKYSLTKTLKPGLAGAGYYSVNLSFKNNKKQCLVHRLVATHFIPNPQNKPDVNHKNGIKTDNRIENLEWVTKSENTHHGYQMGLLKPVNVKGERNGRARLCNEQVWKIRALKDNYSSVQLANMFGVPKTIIYRIVKRETWSHI